MNTVALCIWHLHRICAGMKEASIPVEILFSVYDIYEVSAHSGEKRQCWWRNCLADAVQLSYIYTLTCNLYKKDKASIMIEVCLPYVACIWILYRTERGFHCDGDLCRFYMLTTFTKHTSQDHENLRRISDNHQRRKQIERAIKRVTGIHAKAKQDNEKPTL